VNDFQVRVKGHVHPTINYDYTLNCHLDNPRIHDGQFKKWKPDNSA
jgi:hypothetical protein